MRKNKIVVLDEATAKIDLETEKMIQSLLSKCFQDCTMIVVAHRLQTLNESDRVLVLDEGEVKEFDTPQNLLKKDNGYFLQMVKQVIS